MSDLQEHSRKLLDEVHELTAASLNGTATPEEMARLDRLLNENPQARRLYVRYVDVSCNLRQWASHPFVETSESGQPTGGAAPSHGLLGFLGDAGQQGWGFFADHSRLFSLLAVVLTLAPLAILFGLAIHGGQHGEQASIVIAPVARLTRATDCRWTRAEAAIEPGSGLMPGQRIDLAAGEAEIAFDCGVVLVVYGPSILEVQSGKQAELLMGHAMARAETAAGHGFVLSTRTATAVDLGTEFHVQAAADGHSEIYVTRGAVEVTAGSNQRRRRIEAGQIAQVEPGSAGIIAVIESGHGTPAFKFPSIEPPSDKDYADVSQHHATIRAEGKLSADSGPAAALLDGHAQSKADSPGESCFFADNELGRFVLDLGKTVRIHKINTYSWHAFAGAPAEHDRYDVRATQRYDLYGSAGDVPPSTQGPPAAQGWTLISRVNTDEFFSVPPVKNRPVQQAVSIIAANGDVGRYRFLLWSVKPTHVKALPPRGPENDENTFFGELDVYAE